MDVLVAIFSSTMLSVSTLEPLRVRKSRMARARTARARRIFVAFIICLFYWCRIFIKLVANSFTLIARRMMPKNFLRT